eukprot:CAMPEP_0179152002 /NCGR_PEP_ID=MMETSP0796-20121207/73842_1 /TAXON_ID=73915 /ORGANISM="Pyrodinium bahamense, Strain pbaha01" /LENGTH=53 /DNA_ID=CAMNT_0020853173 /DNA_START=60 /DNA_END=218 /DNA_ORIENTATION=+
MSHGGTCDLNELGTSKAWKSGQQGLGKLTKYISGRACFAFDGLRVSLAGAPTA